MGVRSEDGVRATDDDEAPGLRGPHGALLSSSRAGLPAGSLARAASKASFSRTGSLGMLAARSGTTSALAFGEGGAVAMGKKQRCPG